MHADVKTEPHLQPNQRGRMQMVPLALWSAAVLIILAGTILFADNRKHLRSLSESMFGPATKMRPATTTVAAPQSQHSGGSHPLLLRQRTSEVLPFTRVDRAETRCKLLTRPNQELPVYLETESYSQCTLLYRDEPHQTSPSLFIQIQTDRTGMVSSFRLKFNTEGEKTTTLVLEGIEFLKTFGGFFLNSEEFISTVSNRISRWENFQILLGPYLVEMNQEIRDPTRFNVLGRLHPEHTPSENLWREQQGSTFRE